MDIPGKRPDGLRRSVVLKTPGNALGPARGPSCRQIKAPGSYGAEMQSLSSQNTRW